MARGAPKGNTNAQKAGGTRVPVCLSIADARRDWAVRQLQAQGIEEPTQADIIRFVKDRCYALINQEMERR